MRASESRPAREKRGGPANVLIVRGGKSAKRASAFVARAARPAEKSSAGDSGEPGRQRSRPARVPDEAPRRLAGGQGLGQGTAAVVRGAAHLDSVILTLNAGSSSLKFAAFRRLNGGEPSSLASGQIEGIGASPKGSVRTTSGETAELGFERSPTRVDHAAAMDAILALLRKAGYDSSVAAVGHRIVHGGLDYAAPVLIDDAT